jgi:hypothetical protein
MTDRDTFAAGALAGLLAGGVQFRGDEERDKFCAAVWKLADAMLAERDAAPPAGSPTLTDAEREALECAVEVADSLAECSGAGTGGEPSRDAATLRGLLARAAKEGDA